ncbi:hypothetical protein BDN72DRAFT_860621 [Pluteus cervinus]|uniref:Uncharacterized protein n=1 Tax=Pluteus cervinus TaxID=181527 RepID=A0ACD3AJB4_9AGAR|nr:hypothetical protein BDN72DRAFT_860621 [Pluteus cervinus]
MDASKFWFQMHTPIDGNNAQCIIPSLRNREQWGKPPSTVSVPISTEHDQGDEQDERSRNTNDNPYVPPYPYFVPTFNAVQVRKPDAIHFNTQTVMARHSHRMRKEDRMQKEGVIVPWYECNTPSRLATPPKGDHFPGIQQGDFFVHWISNTKQCQVWMAIAVDGADVLWEPAEWGQQIQQGRYLIIRSKEGKPSAVEKSTWEKTYRRKVSPIVD